jgi:hypothetical protein
MRNITANISSMAAADEGNGSKRAATRIRMARFFFMLNTVFSTHCCPEV